MSSPISGPALTPTRAQVMQVKGEELLAKVRELVRQGNVRRIHVIGEDDFLLGVFQRRGAEDRFACG